VDTQNSQKTSPRDSAKTKQETTAAPEPAKHRKQHYDLDDEPYYDRSLDHVARVRAAREAAQRRMEEFGDISEYEVTIIHGQLKEEPEQDAQPSLDFERIDEGGN
jgi:hypothetical protein